MSKFKPLKIKIDKTFPAFLNLIRKIQVAGKPKIFCIGRNKTGTTSLAWAFRDLGYRVGSENKARALIWFYAKRDFKPIIRFCKTARVFEDEPFSLPYTFQVLDHAFPGSKFILTMRDSADQWYRSAIRHVLKKHGKDGMLPTKEDLKKLYVNPEINRWDYNRLIRDTPEDDIYNEEMLKAHYNHHNNTVLDYFRHRKEDLLVINLAEENSYQRFCDFLQVDPVYEKFPHKNKSSEF